MSPTTRMPVPMIESPASDSGPPFPFSVNIAMSVLLSDDREGIDGLPLAADFEMEVRGRGSPGIPREGDHLPRLNRVPFAHQDPRRVAIHAFISAQMAQEDKQAIGRIRAGRLDDAPPRGTHRRARGHRDIDTRMGLRRIAGSHLPPRDEPLGFAERPVDRLRWSGEVARRSRRRSSADRSEEHTSELQSQFHLVCRLLLEKKKKKKKTITQSE